MSEDMPYPIGAAIRRKIGWDLYHYGIASEYYHPDSQKQLIYQFGGPYEGSKFEDAKYFQINVGVSVFGSKMNSGFVLCAK